MSSSTKSQCMPIYQVSLKPVSMFIESAKQATQTQCQCMPTYPRVSMFRESMSFFNPESMSAKQATQTQCLPTKRVCVCQPILDQVSKVKSTSATSKSQCQCMQGIYTCWAFSFTCWASNRMNGHLLENL